MHCKNCGKYIEDENYNYCPYCRCQLKSDVKIKNNSYIMIIVLTCIAIAFILHLFKVIDLDVYFYYLYFATGGILMFARTWYPKSMFIKIYFWIWCSFIIIIVNNQG